MPRHQIVFDRAILDAPLPQADPVTARELEQQCMRLLEFRRKRRGVAGHVQSLVLAELDSSPTMDSIADELLAVDGLTLADVAGRLGYHDAAGFSRAYRRWTGSSPRRARATVGS